MIFSEMPYQRADINGLLNDVDQLTESLKNAQSADEAARCIKTYGDRFKHFATMEALSAIRYTLDTQDVFYEAEQAYYAENLPALSQADSLFKQAMLCSPFRAELEQQFEKVLFTNAEIERKTVSERVLPLLAEENALVLDYQKRQGGMTAEYDGKTLALPELAFYKSRQDETVRRGAYLAESAAFEANQAELDTLFSRLVTVRDQIGRQLGFGGFVGLGYARMTRNCYGQEEVARFREQVKRDIVPLVGKIKEAQKQRLGRDSIRVCDDAILSKKGVPDPVITGDDLYRAGVEMYKALSPETRGCITAMDETGVFDYRARQGKMPGGYCAYLPLYGLPFIFANFNGTQGDVNVFTHEGGHAFAIYTADQQGVPYELSAPTMEGCEVHSMSMECLCYRELERFFGDRAEEARLNALIFAIDFLPYGCMVDEFQHIVYENPGLTPEQRCEKWLELEKQYRPYLDFDGIALYEQGRTWHRQLHIFEVPFYFIDYCLAQTCALQISETILSRGWEAAWEKYKAYTALAGRYTFIELIQKAGFKNPFEDGALRDIVKAAERYIDEHIGVLE